MTEAEWLITTNPRPMLGYLFAAGGRTVKVKRASIGKADERFRLFGIACCRRVAEVLEYGDTYALDCLEIFAREGANEALLKARRFHRPAGNDASRQMTNVDRSNRAAVLLAEARLLASSAVWSCTKGKPTQAAMAYFEAAQSAAVIALRAKPAPDRPGTGFPVPSPRELAAQCDLLRDIFGNPFPPVAFAESWRSESAVSLARAMYESRNFSPMPVLADALEEAGCDNAEVLSHCRQSDGIHVRGCWVVDGVLGKA